MSSLSGLPTGYITALEQRLTETEAALYAVLASLQRESGHEATLPEQIAFEQALRQTSRVNEGSPRNTRLASWRRLPLACGSDLERWRSAVAENMQNGFGNPRTDGSTSVPADGISQPLQLSSGSLIVEDQPAQIFSIDGRRQNWQPAVARSDRDTGSQAVLSDTTPTEVVSYRVLSRITVPNQRKYF